MALNVTPYRKIMPMAVARVCTRSIPGERNVTVCRLRKTRIYIYIYIHTLWMSIRRNEEEGGGRRGLLVSSPLRKLIAVAGSGRSNKIVLRENYSRCFPLFFTNYREKEERITNVYFFFLQNYASRLRDCRDKIVELNHRNLQ